MTCTSFATETISFVTNDFCLDNGIEGAFTLYQGNGSMVAQDLKHLQYIIHTAMVGEQQAAVQSGTLYLTSMMLIVLFEFV